MSTQRYRVRSGGDLGRVLRDARTVYGLTQQQLVDQLELSFDRTRLARIEAGEGFQSLDRALSVLRRLGIEVYATVPEPAHMNNERTHLDDRPEEGEEEEKEEGEEEDDDEARDEDEDHRPQDHRREDGDGFRWP